MILAVGIEEDFADAVFVGALGFFLTFDRFAHFVVRHVDERIDVAAQQALPRQFTANLALERARRRTDLDQVTVERFGILAKVLPGNPRICGFDFIVADHHVLGLGFLNLQRFIHQVAQHLQPQPLQFVRSDLAAAGCDHQRDALIDIGASDHFTVDDNRGAAVVSVDLAEDLRVFGQ